MLGISLWDGNRVSTLRHFLCHLTERMTQRREKLLARASCVGEPNLCGPGGLGWCHPHACVILGLTDVCRVHEDVTGSPATAVIWCVTAASGWLWLRF